MPYKRSTQRVGFKQRAVDKSAISRANQVSKDLESNRIAEINEMRKYASDANADLVRRSNLDAQRIEYENSNAKAEVDAILNFGKEVIVPIAKQKREDAITKGIHLYEQRLAGDPKAIEQVDGDEQTRQAFDKRVAELRTKALEDAARLEQQFDEEAFKKKVDSLRIQQRIHNVRKLGYNVQEGYRRGLLQSKSKEYANYFYSSTRDSQDEIPGTNLLVNNFYDTDEAGQQQIAAYIKEKFIRENSYGMRPVYLNKYLIDPITASHDVLMKNAFKQKRQADAEAAIKDREANLRTSIQGLYSRTDGYEADFQTQAQDFFNNAARIYQSSGRPGNPRTETKNLFIGVFKNTIAEQMDYDSDPGEAEDAIQTMLKTKVKVPWLGNKEMEIGEIWKNELNGPKFTAQVFAQWHEQRKAITATRDLAFITQAHEAQDEFIDTVQSGGVVAEAQTALDQKLKEIQDNDDLRTPNTDGLLSKLNLAKKIEWLSPKAADDIAYHYLKKDGYIPKDQTRRFSAESFKKYKDSIKVEDFAQVNEKGSLGHQALQTGMSRMSQSMLKAGGISDKNDINPINIQNKTADVTKLILPTAEAMWETEGKVKPQSHYVTEAGKYLLSRLHADNPNIWTDEKLQAKIAHLRAEVLNDGMDLTYHSQNGFEGGTPIFTGSTAGSNIKKYYTYRNDYINDMGSGTRDPLKSSNTPLEQPFIKPEHVNDLQLITQPSGTVEISETVKVLARTDVLDRHTTEILDNLRSQHGLPPIDWATADPSGKILQQREMWNSLNPSIRKLLKGSSELGIDRAQHSMGLMSVHSMHRVFNDYTIPQDQFTTQFKKDVGLDESLNYTDFTNDPDLVSKATRYQINRLGKIAAAETNNINEMIRMVATGMKYGEDQMANYNYTGDTSNPDAMAIDNYSRKALNSYLTGNPDIVFNYENQNIAAISNEDFTEIPGGQHLTRPLTPGLTIEDLDKRLEQLELVSDQIDQNKKSLRGSKRFSKSPEELTYRSMKQKVRSLRQIKIWQQEGRPISPGNVREVIGLKRWNELREQVKTGTSVRQKEGIQHKVLELALQEPIFQMEVAQ